MSSGATSAAASVVGSPIAKSVHHSIGRTPTASALTTSGASSSSNGTGVNSGLGIEAMVELLAQGNVFAALNDHLHVSLLILALSYH